MTTSRSSSIPQVAMPDTLAHFGVECPVCHTRRFLDVQLDEPIQSPELQKIIRDQLAAWMASHCPEHLSALLKFSRN